jgi:hypothetical protein
VRGVRRQRRGAVDLAPEPSIEAPDSDALNVSTV